MKTLMKVLRVLAAVLVSFIFIMCILVYANHKKLQQKDYSEKVMTHSQATYKVRDGETFIVKVIDPITGTELNLITVTLKEDSTVVTNAICLKNKHLTLGEPVQLLKVEYQHNLSMRKNFFIIK